MGHSCGGRFGGVVAGQRDEHLSSVPGIPDVPHDLVDAERYGLLATNII
jgi:hypothetical protein